MHPWICLPAREQSSEFHMWEGFLSIPRYDLLHLKERERTTNQFTYKLSTFDLEAFCAKYIHLSLGFQNMISISLSAPHDVRVISKLRFLNEVFCLLEMQNLHYIT